MKKGRPQRKTCNMDCFNCIFKDCINNSRPTKEEINMIDRSYWLEKPKSDDDFIEVVEMLKE